MNSEPDFDKIEFLFLSFHRKSNNKSKIIEET